jgi:hypothetical protein
MRTLRIETQKEGKGRVFSASLLAYATADALWEGGQTNTDGIRPVFLMFAASEGEVRPFTANLRLGRKATFEERSSYSRRRGPYFELLKSANYTVSTQRFKEGSVVTAYLPELFVLDPGMVDPKGVSFVLLPSKEWCNAQNLDTASMVQHMAKLKRINFESESSRSYSVEWPDLATTESLARIAPLFAAYLDRRSRAPLLQDARFHLQVLVSFLKGGLASMTTADRTYYGADRFGRSNRLGYEEDGAELVGLVPGLAVLADHIQVESVLAEEVTTFLKGKK